MDGIIKNPQDGKNFCQLFNGPDHCSPPATEIHYRSIRCSGNEEHVMDCYREMAEPPECGHSDDAIIECLNVDFNQPQNPELGTVRLVDANGAPAYTGLGRLEFYKAEWMSICNPQFNDVAAYVACQ